MDLTSLALARKYTDKQIGNLSAAAVEQAGEAIIAAGETAAEALSQSIDTTLTVANKAADAKSTGDQLTAIKADLTQIQGLSDDIKQALLDCFQHVAWTGSDGQDYYDALNEALYPPVALDSITAVYTQSGTVYEGSSLDSLKTDLVVTAHYTDSSTEVVSNYVLSGSLVTGTSTITVSYGGKTTTFTVTVTAVPTIQSISATYTPSIVYTWDTLDSLKNNLIVKAIYSDASETVIDANDYTLSGTLVDGICTITVTYATYTTTFTANVNGVIYTKGFVSDQTSTTPKTAAISTNTNRIMGNTSIGSAPLKMKADGSSSLCYPIPIRAGMYKVETNINENRRVCIILGWDSTLNDYKQIYSSGWQSSTNTFYIDAAYRDGSYFIDFNISGPNGTEDMSNVDTSEWNIYIHN